MLYSFLTSLVDSYSFLNVFKYLTFRTGLSVITSLTIVFLIGGPLIKIFSRNQITGPIRQDGPIDHIIKKTGTPTMGGLIIIIGIISSSLLWSDLTNIYVWTLIFVSLSLGGLGFIDDTLKIIEESSKNKMLETEDDNIKSKKNTKEEKTESDEEENNETSEDEDEDGLNVSLAAMEEKLKPKVLKDFDEIAKLFKKLHKYSQDLIKSDKKDEKKNLSLEKKYKKIQKEMIVAMKEVHFNSSTIEALMESLYELNK